MKLDSASLEKLHGVKPDLVRVVDRAVLLMPEGHEFQVNEGLRSIERQKQLVAHGASKTMRSKHLTGDAVDLVAVVAGHIRWDWPLYFDLARIMRDASRIEKVPLVWGGVWDRTLGDLYNIETEVKAYCARHAGPDFLDGPHYQLASA